MSKWNLMGSIIPTRLCAGFININRVVDMRIELKNRLSLASTLDFVCVPI